MVRIITDSSTLYTIDQAQEKGLKAARRAPQFSKR